MEKLLPEKDLDGIQTALENWFKSQEVDIGNATVVAMRFIAKRIVEVSNNKNDLEQGYYTTSVGLSAEIAHYISKKVAK